MAKKRRQNAEKLRGMSPEELDRKEHELREDVWKLRLQLTTGQLQDPQKVKLARRELARLLTIRRERELELELAAAKGAGQ